MIKETEKRTESQCQEQRIWYKCDLKQKWSSLVAWSLPQTVLSVSPLGGPRSAVSPGPVPPSPGCMPFATSAPQARFLAELIKEVPFLGGPGVAGSIMGWRL